MEGNIRQSRPLKGTKRTTRAKIAALHLPAGENLFPGEGSEVKGRGGLTCQDSQQGFIIEKLLIVTIALRKATYTYGNIINQGAFTINIASEKQARLHGFSGSCVR